MKQREVTDRENINWTCVQAYAGLDGEVSEEARELSKNNDGTVTVVCTPSGGAKTVRLQLAKDWEQQLSEEDLANQVDANS